MVTLVAVVCLTQGQAPIVPLPRPGRDGRGRDPWVFRSVFEDRTRMVLLASAPDWWMAFNPETCAMHKVWRGKMDFRGKVWDFSQDNSRAEGRIYFGSPSEIWRLPDVAPLPSDWKADGITLRPDGWLFTSERASLESPAVDGSSWQRVFVAFDETGRKGRFRVSISGPSPQWFDSATNIESETAWQWNFKRVEKPSAQMTVKIETKVAGKKLRNFRLYGDQPAWSDGTGRPVAALWDGYDLIGQTKSAILRYRLKLPGGHIVSVKHQPDLTPGGWQERLTVSGLPRGEELVLTRQGFSPAVRSSHSRAGTLRKTISNGEHILKFDLPEGER